MVAIVFGGKKSSDLQHQLSKFGITETIEVPDVPSTIEEVIRISARSTTKDAVFLSSEVELMDNFAERLAVLNKLMNGQNAGIGSLTGIVMFSSEQSEQFAPTIVEKLGISAIPLQGLVIKRESRPLMIETAPIDPVVSFRVPNWESIKYAHLSLGPLEILERALVPNKIRESYTMGVRSQVQFEINKLSQNLGQQNLGQQNSSQTVVELLTSAGHASRRIVLFSLLATIPGLKPFRNLLRPIAKFFIRHSE